MGEHGGLWLAGSTRKAWRQGGLSRASCRAEGSPRLQPASLSLMGAPCGSDGRPVPNRRLLALWEPRGSRTPPGISSSHQTPGRGRQGPGWTGLIMGPAKPSPSPTALRPSFLQLASGGHSRIYPVPSCGPHQMARMERSGCHHLAVWPWASQSASLGLTQSPRFNEASREGRQIPGRTESVTEAAAGGERPGEVKREGGSAARGPGAPVRSLEKSSSVAKAWALQGRSKNQSGHN